MNITAEILKQMQVAIALGWKVTVDGTHVQYEYPGVVMKCRYSIWHTRIVSNNEHLRPCRIYNSFNDALLYSMSQDNPIPLVVNEVTLHRHIIAARNEQLTQAKEVMA